MSHTPGNAKLSDTKGMFATNLATLSWIKTQYTQHRTNIQFTANDTANLLKLKIRLIYQKIKIHTLTAITNLLLLPKGHYEKYNISSEKYTAFSNTHLEVTSYFFCLKWQFAIKVMTLEFKTFINQLYRKKQLWHAIRNICKFSVFESPVNYAPSS